MPSAHVRTDPPVGEYAWGHSDGAGRRHELIIRRFTSDAVNVQNNSCLGTGGGMICLHSIEQIHACTKELSGFGMISRNGLKGIYLYSSNKYMCDI